jgi:hypothetical protein
MHDSTIQSWLRYTSHEYEAEVEKWKYVAEHLEGTVIDDTSIEKYLYRRKQGESDDAYIERKNIVDYTPHFARATLTLAGMLWSVDYDARRSWTKEENGEGLGNPETEETPMSLMWDNADGRGSNWTTLWKGATIDVISYRNFYVLVDGVRRDKNGNSIAEPTVRIIPPQSVPRVIYDSSGRAISVKVKTSTETIQSQQQKAEKEDRYIIYYEDGFETWRENDKQEPEQIGGRQFYGGPDNPDFRYLDKDRKTPILPIFKVSIPLRANLGYVMARKANAIFNQENTLDFLLWISCFPKVFADVRDGAGNFDKELFEALKTAFKEGSSVIPGKDNKFDAPPTGPAEVKSKILEQKVRAFFTTFFQAYGDAASERTATEIRQDFRAGVEAFLILLGTTMDEAENGAFWRLEQVFFPGQSELWGGAFIKRSTNFQPIDIEQRIEALVARYMPDSRVPVDVDTALDVAIKALESDGIAITPERRALIRERIETAFDREEQGTGLLKDFGIAA